MIEHPPCAAAPATSRAPLLAVPTRLRGSTPRRRPRPPFWQAIRSASERPLWAAIVKAAGSVPAPVAGSACRCDLLQRLRPHLSRALRLSVVLALLAPAAAWATALPPPEGPVVLTLTGAMTHPNDGDAVSLDMAALAALPRHEITTSTVWTEGTSTYTGVLLRTLLDIVGAEGSQLVASAIDGYEVVIPVGEVHADGPIIAFLRDGAPMPVRARGPLWIIYPFDDNPAFRNDTTYARSIWQLTRIVIED